MSSLTLSFIVGICLTLSCLMNPAQAHTSHFFERHAEGWHWYEVPQAPVEENQKEPIPLSSTDIITKQKKELEGALHQAVVSGNPRDVLAYLHKQKALMDQSSRFAQAWQVAILTQPQFDERVKHPTEQFAHDAHYTLQQDKRMTLIKSLSAEYGLFFFFKADCPYCHVFAPIVKGFAEVYAWEVLPISLDGSVLDEFPHPQPDNGISEKLGIQAAPALIAIHPQTKKMIPLAYGVASMEEIERRVESLLTFGGIKP